jgi:hypothetical protein
MQMQSGSAKPDPAGRPSARKLLSSAKKAGSGEAGVVSMTWKIELDDGRKILTGYGTSYPPIYARCTFAPPFTSGGASASMVGCGGAGTPRSCDDGLPNVG